MSKTFVAVFIHHLQLFSALIMLTNTTIDFNNVLVNAKINK